MYPPVSAIAPSRDRYPIRAEARQGHAWRSAPLMVTRLHGLRRRLAVIESSAAVTFAEVEERVLAPQDGQERQEDVRPGGDGDDGAGLVELQMSGRDVVMQKLAVQQRGSSAGWQWPVRGNVHEIARQDQSMAESAMARSWLIAGPSPQRRLIAVEGA